MFFLYDMIPQEKVLTPSRNIWKELTFPVHSFQFLFLPFLHTLRILRPRHSQKLFQPYDPWCLIISQVFTRCKCISEFLKLHIKILQISWTQPVCLGGRPSSKIISSATTNKYSILLLLHKLHLVSLFNFQFHLANFCYCEILWDCAALTTQCVKNTHTAQKCHLKFRKKFPTFSEYSGDS